jgi:prepilin-type N-terminal cleavage/methylation domain-containing protein
VKRAGTPLREQGFTLIELITVVLVLGLLAAVVAPRYLDMAGQARVAAARAAAAEGAGRLYQAFGLYTVHSGDVPPADLADFSGPGYLDLNGNQLDLGDYRLMFSGGVNRSDVRIRVEERDGFGAWREVEEAATTIPWPTS